MKKFYKYLDRLMAKYGYSLSMLLSAIGFTFAICDNLPMSIGFLVLAMMAIIYTNIVHHSDRNKENDI